jgi:hypothetical protein
MMAASQPRYSPVAEAAQADGDGLLPRPGSGRAPMGLGTVGAGQGFGGLPAHMIYPARMVCAPTSVIQIVRGQRRRQKIASPGRND